MKPGAIQIVKTSSAQAVGRQVAERVFGTQFESQSATLGISAEQLSLLWMQGLETQ